MSRPLLLGAFFLLGACAQGLDVGALVDPAEATRRGSVEVTVKSAYPGILDEIEQGGGATITQAMDAAGVPPGDRPARMTQLRGDLGLYRANPSALVSALMLYGA